MISLPSRALKFSALRWGLVAALALTLHASGSLVELRNSIDGYQTDNMRGFANYSKPQLGGFFAYSPIPISSSEAVKLFQFRGIGYGVGPGSTPLSAPIFSAFSYWLNLWSSEAALMTDPTKGDLYSIPLVASASQYPVFSTFGTGPDIGLGGNHSNFQMIISQLQDLNISLLANQTYFVGIGIDVGNGNGDWRWVESNQNLPSDTVISTSFGTPWGTKLASSFTDATTGRLAQELVAQTVPEPGSVVTLLLGASVLCALRRPRAGKTR